MSISKRLSIRVTITAFCFGLFVTLAYAQIPRPFGGTVPNNETALWRWTKEPWQGDDRPFKTVREMIDFRLDNKENPQKILRDYKSGYENDPTDETQLYGWGYASFQYIKRVGFIDDAGLRRAYQNSSAHSREFRRTQYLYWNQLEVNDYLVHLGQRLAQSDKSDYVVRRYLAMSIARDTKAGKEKSDRYAWEILKIVPHKPVGYAIMGALNFDDWITPDVQNPECAKKAIYWYKEYIKRETDEKNKAMIQSMVSKLEGWLKKHPQ